MTVTIPEGYTVMQTLRLLAEKGVNTEENLVEAAKTADFGYEYISSSEDVSRLEGFLFPDTYEFYVNEKASSAIKRLIDNFDRKLDDELLEAAQAKGYSLKEIVTIASLIEKETDGTDQRKIASVIYNRLKNPTAETVGLLQIDATLAYINGGKIPTEADKSIDSPYNTYKYKGLPPAPISNPGLDSIKAAMSPANESYFYYALGDDGVHHYFKTYSSLSAFLATQKLYQ